MDIVMLTIIIPVYNAQKYLNQCMDSLIGQTYSDFEIICVDDGSTDDSFKLLCNYAEQDKRVRVFRQENQYAGVARNRGINEARGKYLLFLDADDFFDEKMIEVIVDRAEQDNAEIIVFDAFQYDDTNKRIVNTTWRGVKSDRLCDGVKAAKDLREILFDFTIPAPWNKLYLREFILRNELWFQSIQRTNDLYFVYASLACAKRIGFINKRLVYYRVNNSSSLQGSIRQTPTIFAEALYALQDFLKQRGLWKDFQRSYVRMAASICIYNLILAENAEVYRGLLYALCEEILPRVCPMKGSVEQWLKEMIFARREMIIYGAGTVAKAVIQYLVMQCNYEREKIVVIVTDTSGNPQEIYGISVQGAEKILQNKKDDPVIIAIDSQQIGQEIEKKVCCYGERKTARIGYCELVDLMRS